ncbi:MAG: hypothetical protein H8E71_04165 [Candidatus Marinimicrobia bacterium]|nr:hypothetical protein [Candidatus Neomarinimicrobiota bacterium]
MKASFNILIVLLFSVIISQSRNNTLKYSDVFLPESFYPYSLQNHPKWTRAFYSLFHETVFDLGDDYLPSHMMILEEDLVKISKNIDGRGNALWTITLPQSGDPQWYFSNGDTIKPIDYKYSFDKAIEFQLLKYVKTVELHGNILSLYLDGNPVAYDLYFDFIKVIIVPYNSKGDLNYGCGPFGDKIDENADEIRLSRNQFHRKIHPSGMVNILITSMFSPRQRFEDLTNGDQNFIYDIPKHTLGDVSGTNIVVEEMWSQNVCKIIFNYNSNANSKNIGIKEFREGILYAIDRTRIMRTNGLASTNNLLSGPYYSDHPGNNPILKPRKKDKIKSNKLLKPFTTKNKIEFTLIHNKLITAKENIALQNIVADLKRVGISVELDGKTQEELENVLKKNEWDLYYVQTDQEEAYTANIEYSTNGAENISGYSNDILYDEFKNVLKTSNVERRMYQQKVHKILYDDVASIFLWTLEMNYAINTSSTNDEHNGLNKQTVIVNSNNVFTVPQNWKFNK